MSVYLNIFRRENSYLVAQTQGGGRRIMWTVGMALTGSTLVNKNMSCGKYANDSGSDEATWASGGGGGALFLSTHSLRPRGGAGGGGHMNRAKNTKHLLHRSHIPFVDSAYITYYYYYIVDRCRAIIKLPTLLALPRRATNLIHCDRRETFLPEIQ